VVNANIVNARVLYFRRRVFTNLFAFSVEFHVSRIRLNIREDLKLTKAPPIPAMSCVKLFVLYQYHRALNAYSRPFCYITSKSESALATLAKGLAKQLEELTGRYIEALERGRATIRYNRLHRPSLSRQNFVVRSVQAR